MDERDKQTSKRHHYLPCSYLKGFCRSNGQSSKLYVFDLDLKKTSRPKSPREVAFEPDWHKIDCPGVEPDDFERSLGLFEQTAAETLAKVTAQLELNFDDLEILLNLASLTSVRVPRFRGGVEALVEQSAGKPFKEAVRQSLAWKDIMRWLPDIELGWSEKDVQRFMSTQQPALATSANYHFFSMLLAQDTLLKLLAERTWSLFVTADDEASFICSDNPVGIIHSPPVVPHKTPFFSERNTVATFPLNRQVVLVGVFDGESRVAKVDRRWVATINSQTLIGAWRYLYGPDKDFVCLSDDGGIGNAAHVFAHTIGGTNRN